jgi:hypothetical protein
MCQVYYPIEFTNFKELSVVVPSDYTSLIFCAVLHVIDTKEFVEKIIGLET